MWIGKTGSLPSGMLDSLSELFCETRGKSATFTRQIRERLRHHALLVQVGHSKDHFSFDHEHFREYFLGEQLGRYLLNEDIMDVRRILRTELVPGWALDTALAYAFEHGSRPQPLLEFAVSVARSEGLTSFIRENGGALAVRLLEKLDENISIAELAFPIDSLRGRTIRGATFTKCYFRQTAIEGSAIDRGGFIDCDFERIDLSEKAEHMSAQMTNCRVQCVIVRQGDEYVEVFDPERIAVYLTRTGLSSRKHASEGSVTEIAYDIDKRLEIVQKVINTFRRCTQASEGVFKLRLSKNATEFFADVLPELLRLGVLARVENQGSGSYDHFKLGMRMSDLAEILGDSRGSYKRFVAGVKTNRAAALQRPTSGI
jgi:hypothetical protein